MEVTIEKSKAGVSTRVRIQTFIATAFFTLLSILSIFPFVVLFIGSFRPGRDLIRNGLALTFDLDKMSLHNYIYLFTGDHAYFTWFKNSVVITAISVITTLFVCYFVAYGLAMYKFKISNLIFFLIIATMMVPFEILMLPLYQEIIGLNLVDTYTGVILPGICSASTIFFFRQYLQGLPKDLLDSGRIDGATEFGICFKIIMPIAKPAFAAMGILCAMGAWNNMLWPMLVFRSASRFTLPIGLNGLMTPYDNNYNLLIAGSMFAILPVFIIFICFQKYFVEGMAAGAVKG